jgi:hypothetical protein
VSFHFRDPDGNLVNFYTTVEGTQIGPALGYDRGMKSRSARIGLGGHARWAMAALAAVVPALVGCPLSRTAVGGSGPPGGTAAAPSALAAWVTAPVTGGLRQPGPTGALKVSATVTIKGAFDETALIAAQGPNGAVFVAGLPGAHQVVWAVDGTSAAQVAEHVAGPVKSLAADAADLYVGTAHTVQAYSRTTGKLVRNWSLGSRVGTLLLEQLAVAGNRLWGLYDAQSKGQFTGPAALVELDPQSSTPVRTVNGLSYTQSIATSAAGVYYVTAKSSQLVEQTNDGHTHSAPTKQKVNLQLSGPAAVQALAVAGEQVVLQDDAGQGLDAGLNTYNAKTLAGPSASTFFSADAQLAETPGGLFAFGYPDSAICGNGQSPCVVRFALASSSSHDGGVGSPLELPQMMSSVLTGPYPTVVAGIGSDVRVLRIS